MRKIICVILTLILVFSAAFVGYQIFREYSERRESADTYTDLENLISFPEVLPEKDPDETKQSESGETETIPLGPTIDFAGLKEINEDCVAWIHIEDTAINYPVVQGSDNSFYLKHLIDGKWNSAGCIFLDSRVDSDLSDRHSIIYGHHMNSGKMFADLEKYKDKGFYEKHPTILFRTIWGNEQYQILSAFTTPVYTGNDFNYYSFIKAQKGADYEYFIREIKRKAIYETGITAEYGDKLLTLSTCEYSQRNGRMVVVAKKIQQNES